MSTTDEPGIPVDTGDGETVVLPRRLLWQAAAIAEIDEVTALQCATSRAYDAWVAGPTT